MAKDNSYPIKINGYIYNAKTKAGFLRMQRQGIPRPMFSIQDKLAKLLTAHYRALVRKMLKDIKAQFRTRDIVFDASENETLEELLSFFDKMGEELKAENEEIANKIAMQTAAENLRREWFEEDQEELERLDIIGNPEEQPKPKDDFSEKIDRIFSDEQKDYMLRLFSDSDDKMRRVLQSFSIDKQRFFDDNLAAVRKLYVDNSLERIQGEKSELRRKMLQRITDYATGKSDELNLTDLTKYAFEQGNHLAHLFARDQMQRFNKACTLASFKSAGVQKVKWATCNDGRVRSKSYTDKRGVLHRAHTELQGEIFSVDNLPIEIDDYNCRCGLIPVEYDTQTAFNFGA